MRRSDWNIRASEDDWIDAADQRLRYRDLGGNHPPILVLHTFRTQLEYSAQLWEILSENYRIYVVDLPGHGQSSQDPSLTYDEPLFTRAIGAFIERLDLEDLTVLGESIGGTIGLSLAAQNVDRLRRVIACNPHHAGAIVGGPLGRAVSYLGRYTRLITSHERVAILQAVIGGGFHDRSLLPRVFVEMLVETQEASQHHSDVMQSIFRNADSWERARDRYSAIPPSFSIDLVYGEADWSPPDEPQRTAAAIPSVQNPTILRRTGHFSFIENPAGIIHIVNGEPLPE